MIFGVYSNLRNNKVETLYNEFLAGLSQLQSLWVDFDYFLISYLESPLYFAVLQLMIESS